MTRELRKLWNRLRLVVSRGVVKRVNAGTKLQELQVDLLADETADEVEHFEPYGLTAKPRAGAEAVAVSVGADRSHLVVLCVGDRRYRITGLADGEVALYNDTGARLHITADGNLNAVPTAAGVVNVGAASGTQPAVLGTTLQNALNTYCASIASAILTHVAIVPPTPAGNAAFIASLGTATATLQAALANILATKANVV